MTEQPTISSLIITSEYEEEGKVPFKLHLMIKISCLKWKLFLISSIYKSFLHRPSQHQVAEVWSHSLGKYFIFPHKIFDARFRVVAGISWSAFTRVIIIPNIMSIYTDLHSQSMRLWRISLRMFGSLCNIWWEKHTFVLHLEIAWNIIESKVSEYIVSWKLNIIRLIHSIRMDLFI